MHAGLDDRPAGPDGAHALRVGGGLRRGLGRPARAATAAPTSSDWSAASTPTSRSPTSSDSAGSTNRGSTWDGAHARSTVTPCGCRRRDHRRAPTAARCTRLRAPGASGRVLVLSGTSSARSPSCSASDSWPRRPEHRGTARRNRPRRAGTPNATRRRARGARRVHRPRDRRGHRVAHDVAARGGRRRPPVRLPVHVAPRQLGGDHGGVAARAGASSPSGYMQLPRSLGPDGILASPLRDRRRRAVARGARESTASRAGRVAAGAGRQRRLQPDSSTTPSGSSLDAIYVHVRDTRRFDARDLGDLARPRRPGAEADGEPSNGIWELREPDRFVSADIGRWLALDRALRLARRHGRRSAIAGAWQPGPGRGARPGARCASARRRAAADYGADRIDASALLLVIFGLLPARDPRAARLVTPRSPRSAAGPLLYRYPPDGATASTPARRRSSPRRGGR